MLLKVSNSKFFTAQANQGLTDTQLLKLSGVSMTVLRNIRHGRTVQADKLHALATALGLEPIELLEE